MRSRSLIDSTRPPSAGRRWVAGWRGVRSKQEMRASMPDVAAAMAKFESRNNNELVILRQDTVPSIARILQTLRRDLNLIRSNKRYSAQAMVEDTAAARAG